MAAVYWILKNTAMDDVCDFSINFHMNEVYDFYRRFHASGGVKAGVSMLGGVHLEPSVPAVSAGQWVGGIHLGLAAPAVSAGQRVPVSPDDMEHTIIVRFGFPGCAHSYYVQAMQNTETLAVPSEEQLIT